jgi:histone deacetylase 6
LDLVVCPIAESFSPDLVLVAAGYDAAEGDPLGGMKVSDQGYALMTERLCALADGKLVCALEGGYGLTATANAAAATLNAMLGASAQPLGGRRRPRRSTVELLTEIAEVHSRYWPVLRSPEHLRKLREAAKMARGTRDFGDDSDAAAGVASKKQASRGLTKNERLATEIATAPATPRSSLP